jgi:hypothetical protein
MIECGHGSGLVLESFAELGVRELDGNFPIETGVARFVDLAHASGADRRKNLVGP